MSKTGTYVTRDGVLVKISNRVPTLRSVATEARDDASVGPRILEGYKALERSGKLGRAGPQSFTKRQIKNALQTR